MGRDYPLYKGGEEEKTRVRLILAEVLRGTLSLLHPFMPFLTEELWQNLPHEGDTILYAAWPEARAEWDFPREAEEMGLIMEMVRAIRNARGSARPMSSVAIRTMRRAR